jgi:hypothetical protein
LIEGNGRGNRVHDRRQGHNGDPCHTREEEPSTMKASMGFGLGGHDRFLIPFMLRAIQIL